MSDWLRRVLLALLGILLLSPGAPSSSAQSAGQVRLAPIEMASFPRITTYLDVRDGAGDFVYGLGPGDVEILEDGQPRPVRELNLLRPGAQFALAINPGPAFSIRDAQGLSRYDYMVQALKTWASIRQGSTLDDLSLVAADGPEATHLGEIDAWQSALDSYQLDARMAVPNFDSLGRALEVAADPTVRPGMGRAVLLITALPDQDIAAGLQSLAARASQRGVRIFVWLIASAEQFSSPGAAQLSDMASQTGGVLFPYSGVEAIPSLEEYLEPLRSAYFLAYDSGIVESGLHELVVNVRMESLEVTSDAHEFELEVLPPEIVFISPRLEIKRRIAVEGSTDPADLVPRVETYEALIAFPDGHPRPLERATLYINGKVADENTSRPFERFSLDLSEYTATGQHSLKLEVVDSLGLSATSVDLPVQVSIDLPQVNVMTTISRNRTMVAGLIVAMAGAVLVLVLVLGGQIRPGLLKNLRKRRRRNIDPVTQPVRMKAEPISPRAPGWMDRLHWPQRRVPPKAFAYMARLLESELSDGSPPIPITSEEITFGRDPLQAIQVLDDPSVDALHARLRREADGSFRLLDEGSTAGTWINYMPVSKDGARLEHGDLVHFGRIGFRFSEREPERVRKPVISPEEPNA
jgi:hypothetical protein